LCSGAPTAEEIKKYLDEHNKLRCLHGHPKMTWDDTTSKTAEMWAQKRLAETVTGHSKGRNGVGENIAWQAGPNKQNTVKHIGEMIQAWYDEIVFCASDTCDKSTDSKKPVGHFTQLIWKDSIKLGCGHASGSHKYGEQIYVVCQYSPGGNMKVGGGKWKSGMVTKKTVKTESQCGVANEGGSGETDSGDTTGTADKGGAKGKNSGALSIFSIAIIVIAILAVVAALGFGYWKYGSSKKHPSAGKHPAGTTALMSKFKQPSTKKAKRVKV